jgi:hypothetical protein
MAMTCSCGSCSFCSCWTRRWTRVDLICSFHPKLMEGFLFENVGICLFMKRELLAINKWVKKRSIHTCIKITDWQMNWDMEKLCWWIGEKEERRWPAWVQ